MSLWGLLSSSSSSSSAPPSSSSSVKPNSHAGALIDPSRVTENDIVKAVASGDEELLKSFLSFCASPRRNVAKPGANPMTPENRFLNALPVYVCAGKIPLTFIAVANARFGMLSLLEAAYFESGVVETPGHLLCKANVLLRRWNNIWMPVPFCIEAAQDFKNCECNNSGIYPDMRFSCVICRGAFSDRPALHRCPNVDVCFSCIPKLRNFDANCSCKGTGTYASKGFVCTVCGKDSNGSQYHVCPQNDVCDSCLNGEKKDCPCNGFGGYEAPGQCDLCGVKLSTQPPFHGCRGDTGMDLCCKCFPPKRVLKRSNILDCAGVFGRTEKLKRHLGTQIFSELEATRLIPGQETMSIEESLFQSLKESKKFLQDIASLGRKAESLIAELDDCTTTVEFRQTFSSQKFMSIQKSLRDVQKFTKELNKGYIAEDEKLDANSLEELVKVLKEQKSKSVDVLEKEKSKSGIRDQLGYKMMMGQAEDCVEQELKEVFDDVDDEKQTPQVVETAYVALMQSQDKLKSFSGAISASVRVNAEFLQRLDKALEVQSSTQKSLLANMKTTEVEARIQAAVIVKDQRKLKALVNDVHEFTAPPSNEIVEKLQKKVNDSQTLLETAQKIQEQVKHEQNMKLQIIEKEFQFKKTALQKTVEPEVLEGMKREIDEMKFRLGSLQTEILEEIKSSIQVCEILEKSVAVERTLHVLSSLASEFHSLLSKSAAEKDKEAAEIPENFLCPILQEIMVDPVLTVDGQTYERSAIEEWLKTHDTSPVTNLPLPVKQVFPNIALKNMIADWRKQHQ